MCKEWIFSNTFSRKPRETDVKSILYRLYEENSKVKKNTVRFVYCLFYNHNKEFGKDSRY